MLNHPAIDVALGLALLYVVLSLAASAVQEWIASLWSLRSKNLRDGIVRLFGPEQAEKVYGHPLVAQLGKPGKLPSYIEPDTLATAVIDLLSRDEKGQLTTSAQAGAEELVARVPEHAPLRQVLEAVAAKGGGGIDELRGSLADWIDEGMTRISGWYARCAKLSVFVIAAVVTVAANASTVHVAAELWEDDSLRTTLSGLASIAAAAEGVEDVADSTGLSDFPLGWDGIDHSFVAWLGRVAGWLMTVAAVSLGAPFWFDLLGKVANLKGAGGRAGKKGK